MITLIICTLLLISDIQSQTDYQYHSKAEGWFKLQKTTAIWKEAFFRCHKEGAVLASPNTEELRNAMLSIIHANSESIISYYIGTHARFSPGVFVSVEGVPLESMPVTDMFQQLHSEDGECLSTNGYNISVVSCVKRLPYICYKHKFVDEKLTQCGTFDKEYRLDSTTGSCYKVHRDLRSWSEAYSICVAEGGYLAILNDKQEARIIADMIPDMTLGYFWPTKWDPLYIGVRTWNGNDTYMSIHADPMEQLYNDWDDGQPDATGQQCGAINRDGKLDNVACNLASFFVCEKNPKDIRYYSVDKTIRNIN